MANETFQAFYVRSDESLMMFLITWTMTVRNTNTDVIYSERDESTQRGSEKKKNEKRRHWKRIKKTKQLHIMRRDRETDICVHTPAVSVGVSRRWLRWLRYQQQQPAPRAGGTCNEFNSTNIIRIWLCCAMNNSEAST